MAEKKGAAETKESGETVVLEKGKERVDQKGFNDDGMDVGLMKGFDCSMRTKAIDYSAITKTTVKLIGAKFAMGWASKFNLHGQKLKPGQFVTVGGETMVVERLQEALAKQVGWSAYKEARTAGTQKVSNKDLVTVSRICKAFAKSTINMILKGIDKPEEDSLALAESSGLPRQYAFICSPYGMTNEEIVEQDSALTKFFEGFDMIITKAKKEGWVEGSTKRSHLKEYEALKSFRGIEIPGEPSEVKGTGKNSK